MKENKVVINVLVITIMILVIVACILMYICFTNDVEIMPQQQEEAIYTLGNYPIVDCSIETLPLAKEFKSNFTKTDVDKIDIKHSKTNNAYVNLINKNVDLILVREPSEDIKTLAKHRGTELEILPIAKDAMVFFVNKDNQVENLNLNQIQKIYSGKIKNWEEVGGSDAKILAFQKPETSTSQHGMLEIVMKGTKIISPITEVISQDTADIIDVIADYDNSQAAIGYSYRYYTNTMYTNDQMKLLSVNGIEPTYENIKTGLYELQTVYYAVIRKDEPEDSNSRKLLNAMVSSRGQKVAKEAGYVENY